MYEKISCCLCNHDPLAQRDGSHTRVCSHIPARHRGQCHTLIQDAYVVVTYYDSKNKQKLAKGWIDAIDETSFTIRNGFWGKKTIAYDKILSLILSEEETTLRQMNEVDRFIGNMAERGIETEQAAIQLLNQKTITTMPLRVRVYAPSIQKGQMVGKLIKMTQDTLVIQATRTSQQVRAISPRRIRAPEDIQQGDITFYQVPITSISHLEVSMGQYRNTGKGLIIGSCYRTCHLCSLIRLCNKPRIS